MSKIEARYLKKIVFINSAKINYLPLDVGGNVHLIGDQGVGKTTILRAFVFFYNPTTKRKILGLNDSDLPFTDFYFPFENSHLIYEIARPNGDFMVWVYAKSGKPVFRFIDSPYRAEFFLSQNQVPLVISDVNNNLRKHKIWFSAEISSFNKFRSIIYGDTKDTRLNDFYILSSSEYQNIPLVITNIFLNAKVEAIDVKDILIKSQFEELFENDEQEILRINLKVIKKDLEDFRQSYNDIVNFENRKNQVDDVLRTYKSYKQKRLAVLQLGAKLYETRRFYQKLQPQLQAELKQLSSQVVGLQDTLNQRVEFYEQEFGRLNRLLGALEDKLNEVERLRKKWFVQVNIQEIKQRLEIRQQILIELNSKEQEYRNLTKRFESIDEKYERLKADKRAEFREKQQALERQIIELEREQNAEEKRLSQELDERLEQLQIEFDKQTERLTEQLNLLRDQRSEILQQKTSVELSQPYQAEIAELETKLRENQLVVSQLKLEVQNLKARRKELEKQKESEISSLKEKHTIQQNQLYKELDSINEQIQELDRLLRSFDGSLYQFLNKHYRGWEKAIGKIAREDVLFSKNLDFELVDPNDDLFYGLRIDLQKLDTKLKTLDDYQKDLELLHKQQQELRSKIKQLNQNYNEEYQAIEDRYMRLLRDVQRAIDDKTTQSAYIQQTILIKFQQKLDDLKQRASAEKAKHLYQLNEKLVDLEQKIAETELQLKNLKQEYRNSRKNVKADFRRLQQNFSKTYEQKKVQLRADITKLAEQLEQELRRLEQLKVSELAQKGVPEQQLIQLSEQINSLKQTLEQLDNLEKRYWIPFLQDKEKYLDNEKQWAEEKSQLQEQIAQLENQRKVELSQLENQLTQLNEQISQIKHKLKQIETGLREFESIEQSQQQVFGQFVRPLSDFDYEPQLDLQELLTGFLTNYSQMTSILTRLKNKINSLTSGLREKNILNWRVKFEKESDYIRFADELEEFVSQNKILEAKRRLMDTYHHILSNLRNKTENLLDKQKEIRELVKSLNNEFDRTNFVEVIETFSITVLDSEHRIVNILREIRDFVQENPPYTMKIDSLFAGEDFEKKRDKAFHLLRQLLEALDDYSSQNYITLHDTFELEFLVVQNKIPHRGKTLNKIGSRGTDILLKAMIYIMLLNVFKQKAVKKKHRQQNFYLHCIMDEIGQIHSKNVERLIKFANERNIWMIFGSPNPDQVHLYDAIYALQKDKNGITHGTKLIYKK